MTFRRTLSIQRVSPGQYVNGIWQEGSISVVNGRYSVQPTSPDDMQRLPEGRRERVSYTLFGNPPLQTADDNAGTNADTVDINGETFEVSAVQLWENNIIPHCKAIVTKVPYA